MNITYNRIFEKKKIIITVFVFLFFLATIFFFFHWPHLQPPSRDTADHYYLAQQIAAGHILYRDLFSDKPPLIEFIGVLCFLVCGGKLLPAMLLIRFVFFLFFILCAIPLFIISKHVLARPYPALLVVLIYLSFNFPYERIALGSEWHTLMNFFGLLSVVFVLKNRYLLGGLFSSLAALSWQPGIIFFIAALSAGALPSPNGKKVQKLSKTVLAFLFPILLLLLYAHLNSSLSDLVKQTILFGEINIRHKFLEGIIEIPRTINRSYRWNTPIIRLGTLGFIINFVQAMAGYKKINLRANFLLLGVLSMTIIYSIVDFQKGGDFIPFIPWLSFYAVYCLTFFTGIRKSKTTDVISACLILGLITYSLKGTINKPPGLTLKKQKEDMLNRLQNFDLKEKDLLLCMESALPLLVTNKKNMVKYLYYFPAKHFQFIKKYEKGGFDSILRLINEKKPKLICIPKAYWSDIFVKTGFLGLGKLLGANYKEVEDGDIIVYVRI